MVKFFRHLAVACVVLFMVRVALIAQATHIITRASLPATCTVGDIYYNTGTNPGLYWCSATNTWTTMLLVSSLTSGGVIYASSSSAVASSGALGANLPVFGGGAGTAPFTGTVSGNTTEVMTATGPFTSGNCVKTDANHNAVDSGGACGGGGGPTYVDVGSTDVTMTTPSSFTNIPGLAIPVIASQTVRFSCQIATTQALGSGAMNFAVAGPASPTAVNVVGGFGTGSVANPVSLSAYGGVYSGGGTASYYSMLHIAGSVLNGANAGNITIQVEEQSGYGDVVVKALSSCSYQ